MSVHVVPRTRVLLLAVIAACLTVLWPSVASAHTDFESSTPTDGATVEGPLGEITLNFTSSAEPAGEGFELLEPSGEIRQPTSIDPTDGTTFVLTYDPPLEAGTYGLRWNVRAGDAHPIDGSFSFTVDAPVPATTAPATTTPPATTLPTTTPVTTESSGATTVPATTLTQLDVPPTTAAATPAASPTTTVPPAALDEFLAGDDTADDAAWVGRVGRTFTFLGLIFGLGTVAALVWVIRGRRDEIAAELNWVRIAGLAIALGGFIEWAGLHMTHDAVATELLQTKAGVAVALKIVGGLVVLIGFHPGVGRVVAPARSLSAATLTDDASPDTRAAGARWVPTTSAAIGLIGFALVLASFWFDGHTVSRGWWPLHAAVNLVHVLAAAVWAGGVFAMTTIVFMRRRSDDPTDTASMVVRFSSIAGFALAAVAVAGAVMTFSIIDEPGDLFSTQWGRVMVAKIVGVALAALLGAYNHFRIRPSLEQRPDDPALLADLRRTLAIESGLFVLIVLLTSWLVAAAI
ncbi:copper transport protein [Ilumatobacter fluminis]|uniref:Copper transport protein n=1 Tax=Ilumatobacter fluminis TaxID=467091 RepID=A0A4R7HX31_9ACTN|nr:CopD family protein [Ilumatobacter fluminis]TDT14746.1 copper transport protein [Ilumatobacter fluminis]